MLLSLEGGAAKHCRVVRERVEDVSPRALRPARLCEWSIYEVDSVTS